MDEVHKQRLAIAVDNMPFYLQVDGRLEKLRPDNKIGNCCLGVLCREAMKQGLNLIVETDSYGITTFDGDVEFLPRSVQEFYGLPLDTGQNPLLLADPNPQAEGMVPATALNDTHNWDLTEIARAFRETFLE